MNPVNPVNTVKTLEVRNPRTGTADTTITVATAEDVATKATRLRNNQVAWAAKTTAQRVEVMRRWLSEVAQRAVEMGEQDAVDTGGCHTSYLQGYITMGNIQGWVEDAERALEAAHVQATSVPEPSIEITSQLVPYQLVGVISPWNAPMMLALLDAVPALFAGSAVLLKPSEVTPRFLGPLFESVAAVPELHGVFDYVLGDGATGQHLLSQVDMVCFTGSEPTGKAVARACAERLIPCYLELGGKDPAIVTGTADLERAVTAILRGGVYATGQVCYSTERIYVHADIHDEFVHRLTTRAEEVRLNSEDPRAGHIGPFISHLQPPIVQHHLDDAVARGATIRTGGQFETIEGGVYLRPTVLTDVDHQMLIMQEETFGPVLPVMKYHTIEEAIALANDTRFGLTASVIAGTAEEALEVGRHINAGSIFIQDTFLTAAKSRTIGTHAFGHSGLGGSRTGPDSILRFIRRKALLVQQGEPANILNDHHLSTEVA